MSLVERLRSDMILQSLDLVILDASSVTGGFDRLCFWVAPTGGLSFVAMYRLELSISRGIGTSRLRPKRISTRNGHQQEADSPSPHH